MSDVDREARRREHKETPLPAGIFSVRNTGETFYRQSFRGTRG